jgi:hypothetical protein
MQQQMMMMQQQQMMMMQMQDPKQVRLPATTSAAAHSQIKSQPSKHPPRSRIVCLDGDTCLLLLRALSPVLSA